MHGGVGGGKKGPGGRVRQGWNVVNVVNLRKEEGEQGRKMVKGRGIGYKFEKGNGRFSGERECSHLVYPF